LAFVSPFDDFMKPELPNRRIWFAQLRDQPSQPR
jgi:hypothetical protein